LPSGSEETGFPLHRSQQGRGPRHLSDLGHAAIIDVEPPTAVRQAAATAAKTMMERARVRLDLWPERLSADTAYSSAEMLNWLMHDQGIESPTSR
jgi:hypothetical protein